MVGWVSKARGADFEFALILTGNRLAWLSSDRAIFCLQVGQHREIQGPPVARGHDFRLWSPSDLEIGPLNCGYTTFQGGKCLS